MSLWSGVDLGLDWDELTSLSICRNMEGVHINPGLVDHIINSIHRWESFISGKREMGRRMKNLGRISSSWGKGCLWHLLYYCLTGASHGSMGLTGSQWPAVCMNSMKLVIPLHSIYWSIHTKDESKRGTAFAFFFGVNWLWRCGVTASFGVFYREIKCNAYFWLFPLPVWQDNCCPYKANS